MGSWSRAVRLDEDHRRGRATPPLLGRSPARQHVLRQHNLALVLQHIAAAEPVSRADIAGATGLTKATVSSLVDALVSVRLVSELGPQARGAVGRPGNALTLSRAGFAGVGLEIDVDYIAVCVADLVGGVRDLQIKRWNNGGQPPAVVIERAVSMSAPALEAAEAAGMTIAGLVVAVPGLIATDAGIVKVAPNLGWRDVPLADLLAERFARPGLSIMVDNDANLAALGELWFGGHDDLANFVYVSCEIGVGAGIVVGGELFRGARGFAGEAGHIAVQPDGPRCHCGARGCLEQVAGSAAMLRSAGLDGAVGSSVRQPDGPAARLDALARDGHPDTVEAMQQAGRALGIGLSTMVNLLDPGTVMLGGIYASLEPWLRPWLLEELGERAITQPWSPVRVLTARLGPDAGVRGAAGTAIRNVLADPAAVLPAGVAQR
jgi:predicted NBD/HSP70 family sugar kinase